MSVQDGQNHPDDTVFQMLSNWRRRAVLQYLHESQQWKNTVTFEELVEAVCSLEQEGVVGQRGETDRADVEDELYNVHLPALADTSLVDYDERNGEVRYAGTPFLERIFENLDSQWRPEHFTQYRA